MNNEIITIDGSGETVRTEIDDNLVNEWKSEYKKYRPQLNSNRKTVAEIIEYICSKYSVENDSSQKMKSVVTDNITMNEFLANRNSAGRELVPIVLRVKEEGNGIDLYNKQKDIFKGIPIIIGLEKETGYVFVEGSSELSDEITAFQGLDEDELNNYYLVANYIRCLKKFSCLDNAINSAN